MKSVAWEAWEDIVVGCYTAFNDDERKHSQLVAIRSQTKCLSCGNQLDHTKWSVICPSCSKGKGET